MNHGNQHASRKADLLTILNVARSRLRVAAMTHGKQREHLVSDARYALAMFRAKYNAAPASTRRRWACGH